MTLQEFKEHFESFPNEHIFKNSISRPFSWRGSYSEVAFSIELNKEQTKEEALEYINEAYENEFYGYKGGKYTYDDYTEVYFEYDTSSWSDGGYTSRLLAEIENSEPYISEEHRLTKKAFV